MQNYYIDTQNRLFVNARVIIDKYYSDLKTIILNISLDTYFTLLSVKFSKTNF